MTAVHSPIFDVQSVAQIRKDLRRYLSTLDAAKEEVEASLISAAQTTRLAREIGLREASLSAEQYSTELAEICQLQFEANKAFRQAHQQFEAICQQIARAKEEIRGLEVRLPNT